MAKLALTDLVNLQNENTAVSAINANSAAIETAMENTLSRDGLAPNQMLNDLDLNSHRILNADAFIQDVVVEVINNLSVAGSLPVFSGTSVTITPEMFGSTGTYLTDEAAFLAMRNYTQAAGGVGVTWEFMPGKTYKVFGNPTLGSTTYMFNCNFATKGLRVKTNGCKFECDLDWVNNAPNTAGVLFNFKDAEDLQIDRIELVNTVAFNTTVDTTGTYSLVLSDACRGVRVGPLKQVGGLGCITINRTGTFITANRGEGFDFELIDATNVYYPLSCQANGDYVKANVKSLNAGRTYFSYNIKYHDLDIDFNSTRAGEADQVLIKVYTYPGEINVTEFLNLNIKAKYRGTVATFSVQQLDATSRAGTFRNIYLDVYAEPNSNGPVAGAVLFQSSKVAQNGSGDNVPRGHIFDNVFISGSAYIPTDTYPCILFFAQDWTGDNIYNFGFRNFTCTQTAPATTSFYVDGRGINGRLVFENVLATTSTVALSNMAPGTLCVSNTRMENFKSNGAGTGAALGGEYVRQDAGRLRMYGVKSCAAGTADTVVTLPLPTLTGTGHITGLVNQATGNSGISAAVLSTTTFNIHREDTTGTKDIFWEVSAKSDATGSPGI